MHPSNLLACLAVVAAIAGAWTWGSFKEKEIGLGGAATLLSNAGSNGPQAMLPELSSGTVGDGPTGTLQRQIQRLEEQNQLLQKENQDLRGQLSKALQANAPPPEPDSLAERLGALRELKFVKPPKFKPVPMEELQSKIMAAANSQITDEDSAARSKAYLAMNFVNDPFSYREAVVNAVGNQAVATYLPESNEALYQNDADLRRVDGRDRVMAAAHWALLQQNFPRIHPLPMATNQDDAACAVRALAVGDNTLARIRWSLQDDLINLTDGPTPGYPRQDYTPLYFSEQFKFCADQGKTFVDSLMQEKGVAGISAAYVRLPQSTAELLHPELYLATPPFQPIVVPATDGVRSGAEPYFTNVAGEFSTDISFRYFMSPDLAVRIADGWAGDRYWVYAGEAQYGDQVLWKTHWRTAADGQEFYDGMRRVLMQRFKIPYQKEYDQPGAFIVSDPHRLIRLRISEDKLSVTLVNATETNLAEVLDDKT
jgi:hypothetical protein